MKYAHYKKDSFELIGWYSKDVHDSIPEPHIEVSEEIWQESLKCNYNCIDITNNCLIKKDFSTSEERMSAVRNSRNSKLSELDLIIGNPFRFQELSDDIKNKLKEYRQNLLDVPQQSGFPDNVNWPVIPEF